MNAMEFYQARTEMGITQRQMAKEVGTYQCVISKWENGLLEIPERRQRKIREVMRTHGLLVPEVPIYEEPAQRATPEPETQENNAIPFPIRKRKDPKISHIEKYKDVPPMALLIAGKTRIAIHDYSVSMGKVEKVLSAVMVGLSEKSGYCWNNIQQDKHGKFIKKVCGKIYLDSLVYCEPELANRLGQETAVTA